MPMPSAANLTDESGQADDVASTSMPSPLHRAEGVTASERYLSKLCDRSFLTLWSHSHVFRDQRINNGASEGKELCDVLVVFENDVIIFSDKDCVFPDTGDLQTDWRRWYREAIKKSAKQTFGAERWLKEHPDKVFLDPACTQPFPYPLPAPDVARYHRIVVAKGCAKRCQEYFNPDAPWVGIGSLVVDSTLHGDDHLADFADPNDLTSLAEGGRPFTVGHVDIKRGFVHVLDETTLDKLLTHLDTVADFVAYLTKKEDLLANYRVMATGEEELLGYYLGHVNAAGENDFPPREEFLSAIFAEGIWLRYLNGPERAAQVEADQPSHIWDSIIEHSSAWLRTGNSELSFHDHERLLRYFAREPRLRRRLLGRSILDLVTRAQAETGSNPRRLIQPLKPDEPYFAIQIFSVPFGLENKPGYEANYHEVRRKYLEAVCMAAKIAQPTAKIIVGYSVGSGRLPCELTEDLLYVDTTAWTEYDYREAESLRHDLALWVDVAYSHSTERTFPIPRPLVPMTMPRKKNGQKAKKHR